MVSSRKRPGKSPEIRGSMRGSTVAASLVEATKDQSLGNGLVMRVRAGWGGESIKAFALRYTFDGKRREIGLGGFDITKAADSLAQAQREAESKRRLIEAGHDPKDLNDQKRDAKAAKVKTVAKERNTFARVAAAAHKAEGAKKKWRNDRHREEWLGSLQRHLPDLWDKPIDKITTADILPVLEELAEEKTETANRVRQRLEAVFRRASLLKLVDRGHNPARELRGELPTPESDNHHASLPYSEVPAFMARLREMPGHSGRALEFAILTASRSLEARGAQWSEFDAEARTWTVPAARMKPGRDHVVHLSDAALAALAPQRGHHEVYVFPTQKPISNRKRAAKKATPHLSDMSLLKTLERMGYWGVDVPEDKRISVHGFRSSFSTWANQARNPDGTRRFDEAVIEAALSHTVASRKGEVAAAYDQSEHLDARQLLLNAWADYCSGGATS